MPLPSPTVAPAEAVRVDHLRVVRGGHDALGDVDLRLRPAELAVLVGPNGAGKSTLLEVLAGVLPPTSGEVVRTTGSVAFVPQRTAVPDRLPLTVRDVVTMGAWGEAGPWRRVRADGRRRVAQAISVLGLETLVRRPFATLSGGERQRALLAQGLARGADLLLLDEPTTGLDRESTAHICDAIRHEVTRGTAVVCVSHDQVVVDLADRVVRLERGRLVGDEPRPTPASAPRGATAVRSG